MAIQKYIQNFHAYDTPTGQSPSRRVVAPTVWLTSSLFPALRPRRSATTPSVVALVTPRIQHKRESFVLHKFILGALFFGIIAGILFGVPVHAATTDGSVGSTGLGSNSLTVIIVNIINWALGLLGLAAVVFVIYGGFLWLTAAGNEERIEKAKRVISAALIGLVIVLLSWAIVNFVLKLGQDVTGSNTNGGGGGSCSSGEQSGCYTCNTNGGWDYSPSNSGCSLPQDTFEIRNITTSCSTSGDYQNDVFRCSSVSVVTNHTVDTANLKSLVETSDALALKVEQCADGSSLSNCVTPSQPAPLFSASAPAISYAGSTPTGQHAEIVASGKSVNFVHSNQLFAENTYYRITIPKSVQDTSGKQLSGCKNPDGSSLRGCTDAGTAFQWIFHVGTATDTTAPSVVSSYPVSNTADTSYPDRNVNRAPILSVRLSEAIAPWTVTTSSVKIFQYTTAPDDHGVGGVLASSPLDASTYSVNINTSGDGLELNFTAGSQLDAFHWYSVSVAGVNDLCSNTQSPSPYTWAFETNGIGAGVAQTYPANNFASACPNTDVFVQFTTSMYDPATSSCAVSPGGKPADGGFVTSGSDLPPRSFQVRDDIPQSGSFNPNDFCRTYSWEPSTKELATNGSYAMTVATRYPVDTNGTTLKANWSFKTTEPGKCANAPYISMVSPAQGQAGRCMTVIGSHFDDASPAGQGANDTLAFQKPDHSSLTVPKASINSWSGSAIVTNAPDVGASTLPFSSPITVTVDYGSPIGTLSSDATNPLAQFTYTSTGSYDGPCLYALTPDTGFHNNSFTFAGERLNPQSATQAVQFGASNVCVAGNGQSCWTSDTSGRAAVPASAPDSRASNVAVKNDKGTSNALPYFVQSLAGDAFQVISYVPSCGGNESCTNAAVSATFSQSLNATTVTGGDPAQQSTVELFSCDDATCDHSKLHEVQIDLVVHDTQVDLAPHSGLAANTWYRAVLTGGGSGLMSSTGKELGGLNYDANSDGQNDAYTWTFGTTTNASVCALSSTQCQPSTTSVTVGGTRQLTGHAYSNADACSTGGSELNANSYSWLWNSTDAAKVSIAPSSPNPATTATGTAATTDPVAVTTQAEGKVSQCTVTVSNDSCITDTDCVNNNHFGGANACTGSVCKNNTCTPVVTSISPAAGAVGTWVTVRGCYFDQYTDGQSSVTFLQSGADQNDDKHALWPVASVCGDPHTLWQDNQVIVEVPNKSTTETSDDVTVAGKVRVTRRDGVSADSGTDFTPNGTVVPGICKITPTSGKAGVDKVSIQGQNLDTPPPSAVDSDPFFTSHTLAFYNNLTVNGTAATWKDNSTIQNVTIPNGATNNTSGDHNELSVTTPHGTSNAVNLDIVQNSCTVCSGENQCGSSAQQCIAVTNGSYSCCQDRPEVATFQPQGNAVCRNAAVTLSFRDAVDHTTAAHMSTSTINPQSVEVIEVASGAQVTLTQASFSYPNSSSVTINPGVLKKNTAYKVIAHGSIQNANNASLGGDVQWMFTSANSDDVCTIDHVSLTEDTYLFTALHTSQSVTAQGYGPANVVILPVQGLYDWTWQWTTSKADVASVSQNASGSTILDTQQITGNANGNATITGSAKAGAGWTGSRSGTASVQVSACVSAWPASPDVPPFNDSAYNFSTWYCRDHGASVCAGDASKSCSNDAECNSAGPCLYDAVTTTSGDGTGDEPAGSDTLLRQYFFEYPKENATTHKKDVIGVLVWQNNDHLSPADWFTKKFSQTPSSGTTVVDGYQAMKIGTSTYVAATNLSGNALYTNMYVFGYNDDASADVTSIFGQMMDNLALNSNESLFAYGTTSTDTALQQVRSDTKRVGDLESYIRAITTYDAAVGHVPQLGAGSYLTGMSVSTWPSWAETLQVDIGSKVAGFSSRTDAVNAFSPACAAPFEGATCWDNTAKQFSCSTSVPDGAPLSPDDSHVYAYVTPDTGKTYNLFAHLDYAGTGSWQEDRQNPCGAYPGSTCSCFNYSLYGASAGGGASADSTAPTTPQHLTGSASGPTSIVLQWDLSTDTSGSGVQYYSVSRSEDGATYVPISGVDLSHPTHTLTDTDLSPDYTYYYKVSAVDVAGNVSTQSSPVGVTTPSEGDIQLR